MGPGVDYAEWMTRGATIVDVRTTGEYSSGHIKGSLNIPLGDLSSQFHRISKEKPVITCCASGMRSGQAASFLKAQGYGEVHNGGGWKALERKL